MKPSGLDWSTAYHADRAYFFANQADRHKTAGALDMLIDYLDDDSAIAHELLQAMDPGLEFDHDLAQDGYRELIDMLRSGVIRLAACSVEELLASLRFSQPAALVDRELEALAAVLARIDNTADPDLRHKELTVGVEEAGACAISELARHYLLTLLPNLVAVPYGEILELRSRVSDSMGEFLSRSYELSASVGLGAGFQRPFVAADMLPLEIAFADLRRETECSKVWRVARERFPLTLGTAVGLTGTLVTGSVTGHFSSAAIGAGAVTIGQIATHVLEALRRRRRLKHHWLYWRYELQKVSSARSK